MNESNQSIVHETLQMYRNNDRFHIDSILRMNNNCQYFSST